MHDGNVVVAQVQPALDAVALGEDAVQRGRLSELSRGDPWCIDDLVFQLRLPIHSQRLPAELITMKVTWSDNNIESQRR